MLRSFIAACAAFLLSITALSAQDSDVVDMVLGAPDAKIEVIEYASYTCPHCARFHEGPFKQLKENYIDTGKVKFVYREVYFDRFGLWASMVARCAGPQRFFGITDMLYAEQSNWSRAGEPEAIVGELRKVGKVAGLTDEMLDACLQDAEKAQALVTWYQGNAEKDEVRSTPTFIINGEKHDNMSYDDFAALLDGLLEE